MSKHHTLVVYIAPNSGEVYHAQARIYMRLFVTVELNNLDLQIRDCYNERPEMWRECGLMKYDGKLVCFDGPLEALHELQDSQPLMAGANYRYECDATADPQYVRFASMRGPLAHLQNTPKEK